MKGGLKKRQQQPKKTGGAKEVTILEVVWAINST
jgi:hypothetical protein